MKNLNKYGLYTSDGFISDETLKLLPELPKSLSEINSFDLAKAEPSLVSISINGRSYFATIVPIRDSDKTLGFNLYAYSATDLLRMFTPGLNNIFENSVAICRSRMQNIVGLSSRIASVFEEAELYNDKKYIDSQIINCYQILRNIKNLEEVNIYSANSVSNKSFLIAEIIKPVCKSAALLMKNSNQKLIVDIPDETLTVYADPKRLENAFLNLLANAYLHSSDESEITVSITKINNKIILNVSDNGFGMSSEMLKSATRFSYSETESDSKLGLGLYLVKRFTESCKGSIIVSSKENEGTSVSISIPESNNEAISLENNIVEYFSRTLSPVEIALCEVPNCNLFNSL